MKFALMRVVLTMLCGAGLLHAQEGPSAANATRDSLCAAHYNVLRAQFTQFESDLPKSSGCNLVARVVLGELIGARRNAYSTELEPRTREAVQTTRGQTINVAGEAASAVEPVETAAGSIGAVGSEGGSSAIAAIAINPALFLISPNDEKGVARWGRFTDLSLLVPISDADKDEDGDVDYIGVRWRINITGLSAGDSLFRAVAASFERILARGTGEAASIHAVLSSVPEDSMKVCIASLLRSTSDSQSPDEISAAFAATAGPCGKAPFKLDESQSVYTQFAEDVRKARVVADSRYFGVDLRGDFGDLKRFGVDTLKGRSMALTVGYGRRFPFLNSQASNGLRANLGVRFVEPNGTSKSRFAGTGGLAYEIIRYYEHQRLSLVAGLEFEADNQSDSDSTSGEDVVAFRATLNLPLAGTTSLSLSFGAPVAGAGRTGPTLTVKANWRLLWTQ